MNRVMARIRLVAVALAVVFAGLIGWQQFGSPEARAPRGNLAGSTLGGPFTLTDQDGRQRTNTDFAGQWRLMYFGYTFCPDVCPTDLANIGQAMRGFEKANPARAAKVTPIFITVDPERDTADVLKPYVSAFHPRLVGLTGPPASVEAVMKRYGIYAKKAPTRDPDAYLVDHFAVYYLFDDQGRPVAFVPHGSTAQEVQAMLETYVR